MYKISVLDYRFDSVTKSQVQELAKNKVKFWEDRCPLDERISRTGDSEVALITPWEKIDKEYLDACPNLKYIGLCGTSTANIDLDELEKRGIEFSNIVTHTPKIAVAEFFFMQLVRLARGSGKYQWKNGEEHTLIGKNLGIIGLGDVGQGFAHIALAYNMNVSYFSPNRKKDWEKKGLKYLEKDELLSSNEIIVLCSPSNVEVIGKAEFEAIQQGSIIVQACSGSPFDKPAFKNWVKKDGNFALFDMSASEKNYQLHKDLPGVIFSWQVAGDTYESNQRRGKRAIKNLKSFIQQNPS